MNLLEKFYPKFLEDEKFNLKKIQFIEERKHYIGFMSSNNVHFALHALNILKDDVKSRQYFYKAAVCSEYMIKIYNWELQTGIPKICYALLSDNNKVIERFKEIKDKEIMPDFIGYQFVTSIQSILKDNSNELQNQIDGLKISTAKKGEEGYKGLVTVFEGFLYEDQPHIEKGLNELIKTHKKREKIALVSDYFSVEVAALAKLAYIKGIEVVVESSLVPKEILPIQELANYEGYDFFKEIGY
jgi:hypothetical protein